MEKKNGVNYEDLWDTLNKSKGLKIVFYAGGALLVLYLVGQSFRIVASAVRGYKDMATAIKS